MISKIFTWNICCYFVSSCLLFYSATSHSQTTESFVQGQIFIKVKSDFRSDISYDNEKSINTRNHPLATLINKFRIAKIVSPFRLRNPLLQTIFLAEFPVETDAGILITEITKLPFIEYAEPVPDYQLFLTPNDLNVNQWHLSKIQAQPAWDITTGSSNVIIAMVDDAVLLSHEDLAPVIWINPGEIAGNSLDDDGNGYVDDINGWDAADNDNNPNPPATATNTNFTHGTHTSGIAGAATDNGLGIASISYNVKIMAVKTKIDASSGGSLQAPYLGVEYAIAAGANVISMSWGGGAYSQTYQSIFDLAYSQGIVLVAAAGNSNTSIPMYPAAYNNVISVGATDNQDLKASFSNYGTTVDLMAPGVGIFSCLAGNNSSYGNLSGTSMACPLVAGLATLMLSKIPYLTPDEIESCLKSSSENIDALNPSFAGQLGAGRINGYEALLCAKPISALFTSNYLQVCPGATVQFYDQSTNNPISWQWSFSGGVPSSSTIQNPVVQYSSAGTYSVTLIVTNSLGTDTIIKNNYITVAQPSAIISGSATVNAGFQVNLPIILTGNPPWTIIYTDGSTNFTITNITNSPYYLTVAPLVTTTYSLLFVSDNGCAGNASGSAIITVTSQNDPFCLNIKSVQKISDLTANFSGNLSNSDLFGGDIAVIGDLDGDGINEVAVGAGFDDDGGTDFGAIYVLFLNTNGLLKSYQKISDVQGNFSGWLSADDRLGGYLGNLGDFDKDGINDLLAGVFYDDDGGTNRGAVYILLLNANGTVKSAQKISDTQGGFLGILDDNDVFGSGVTGIGDLDGDGNRDIAVSAAFDDDGGTDKGAVWILFLNANGTVKSYQKISDTQGNFTGVLNTLDRFGFYVATIGDIDLDGVKDVVVGAPTDDDGGTDQGAVWILFLNTNGTVKSHQKISEISGNFNGTLDPSDNFGARITSLGDLNKDNIPDIAVGAAFDDDGGTDKGAVWILYLASDGTVKSYEKISSTQGGFSGTIANGDEFSSGISAIGDIDGNNVIDLAVGARRNDDGGTDRGAVYIISFEDTCLPSPLDPFCLNIEKSQKISNTQGNFSGTLLNNDFFGRAVTSIGDLDNDGVQDLAVGALGDDDGAFNRGAVWILFMNADGTVKSSQKISDTQGNFTGTLNNDDRFGASVSGLGDLDGDGNEDIVAGAHLTDENGADKGSVWVLFLNPDGTVKSYQKITEAQGNFTGVLNNSSLFGISVENIGDLDGDNITDIAVGAQGDNDGGTGRGSIWIIFLNTNGTVKTSQKISDTQGGFTGILDNDDRFGSGVSGIDDVNGDTISDLVVGAEADDDGVADGGAIWILFLNSNGTVNGFQKISATQGNFTGSLAAGVRFGASVSSLGDLDKNGISDLVVGSPFDDDGGIDKGSSWVLFLNNNGTVLSHYKISDTQGNFSGVLDNSDFFAVGLCGKADLNGDGIKDIFVGAQYDDDGGSDRGAVYVIFLEDTCPPLTIIQNCNLKANFTSDTVCIGDSISFYDLSIDSIANIILWKWNFDDGDSATGIKNPKHLYSLPVTFSVTLIVANDDSLPCFDTITKQIFVLDTNTIFAPPDTTICKYDSVSLGPLIIVCADPPYTYNWSPATGIDQPLSANPKASPSSTIIYHVTVTDSAGVVSTDSITVTVNPGCCRSYAMIGSNGYYCYGDSVTFQNNSIAKPGVVFSWNFGLNATPSAYTGITPPPVYFDTTGIIRIRLIVNDSCGTDTGFHTINIYPLPIARVSKDTAICVGDTIQLFSTNVSNFTYAWSPDYNIEDTALRNPYVFPGTTTAYILIALNSETGCSASDTVLVSITDPISISLGNDTSICQGDSLTLSAGSLNASYLWSNGDSGSSLVVTGSGIYWVSASSKCNTSTDSITVSNREKPFVFLGKDTSLCESPLKLSPQTNGSAGFLWSTGETTATISVAETGLFSVVSRDIFGCENSDTIRVKECKIDIFIPNTITPNNDGDNDKWMLTFLKLYPNHKVQVFNRNGNKVYESENYKNDWDGTWNDNPLPSATYYYIINLGNDSKPYKGTITIILE